MCKKIYSERKREREAEPKAEIESGKGKERKRERGIRDSGLHVNVVASAQPDKILMKLPHTHTHPNLWGE